MPQPIASSSIPVDGSRPQLDGSFGVGASIDPAEAVIRWNQLAIDLAAVANRGPTISSRLYAYVNTAIYDSWALFDPEAVPSIVTGLDARRLERLLSQPSGTRYRDIVMATAAHAVFSNLASSMLVGATTPLLAGFIDRSRTLFEASLNPFGGRPLPAKLVQAAGRLGSTVAASIQTWALNDGANQQNNYQDTTGYAPKASVFDTTAVQPRYDQTWQPLKNGQGVPQTALTPHWGGVRPFAIGSGSQLTPASILPVYSSGDTLNPAFVAEANQVLEISQSLTPEQKVSAEVWESGPGTGFPPGAWLGITNALIRTHRLDLGRPWKTQAIHGTMAL